MRIVSTYIADDGTRFTTEEECLEYERRENAFSLLKDVFLFREDGTEIKKLSFFENMEQFEYIYIGSKDSLEVLQELNEEFGYILPDWEGFWKFESDDYGAEVLIKYEKYIEEIREELNKYANMEYIIQNHLHNIE